MSELELPDVETDTQPENQLDRDDHLRPEFVRAVLDAVEDGDDEAEADGQRDHEEVVDGGDAELPPCEFEGIHEAALLRQAIDRDDAVAGYHHPSPRTS